MSVSSSPPSITGCVPGQLDTTQTSRLLRSPENRLSFASFDPRTAFPLAQETQSTVPDIQKLSIHEQLYRPKRVVIETEPSGQSSWRFVPNARREEGVLDEGKWPRIVDICGQKISCTLEQWDIYKLDPIYSCLVRVPTQLSEITRIGLREPPAPELKTRNNNSSPSKRRLSSPPHEDHHQQQRKQQKMSTENSSSSTTIEDEEDDEEVVVESMIVDEHLPKRSKSSGPARARKLKLEKEREERREKMKRKGTTASTSTFYFSPPKPPNGFSEIPPKRKVSSLFDSLRTERESPDFDTEDLPSSRTTTIYTTTNHKRTRRVSPRTTTREMEAKKREREKQKAEKREIQLQERRLRQEKQFMEEVLAEVPVFANNGQGPSSSNGTRATSPPVFDVDNDEEFSNEIEPEDEEETSSDREAEDEARRQAIAESRRKLAQLEADRPLWESEAKKREARERAAEEDARQFKLQEQARVNARKAEAERKASVLKLEEEERARKRRAETKARMEREKRQRNQRYSMGPWTVHRALERYRTISDSFDASKFALDNPISFDLIPWPVLQSPVSLSIEDIDWAAVEKFFDTVKPHIKAQDYKKFVIASHRRFHPDRWRSRGLLKSVEDEAERECLEVAANTVAQAITPLWTNLMANK